MGRRWRRMKRGIGRGWDNFKYEASFRFLQFGDWFGRKWHSFWGVRWGDIRWGRSLFFTAMAIIVYISSIYVYGRQTYIPNSWTSYLWSCWNWFFWPAIVTFWLEEIIDAGKEERNKLNPWPKGLFLFYAWIILGSLLMSILALITSHDFYLKELQSSSGYEEVVNRKDQLEKELAEAEGRSPSGGSPEERDPLFDKESDDLFSEKTEGERSPSRIKVDLWWEHLKDKTWNKIFSKSTGIENIDALRLRFSKAGGWFKKAASWLPTFIIFLIVVLPTYGLQALESRTVTLLTHMPLISRAFRRRR